MATITPADIVAVWEKGAARPLWSRALLALGSMLPEKAPATLAGLSIGRRNAHLLALRDGTFGPTIHAVVKCPRCGEPLEFEQHVAELLDDYVPPAGDEFLFVSDETAIRYRLLTSNDLRRAAASLDEAAARATLIASAVIEARVAGVEQAAAGLSAPVLAALADDMAANDPLAQIVFPLACAACEHVWPADFDIASFLWTELERQARHTLEDVVTLAQNYGWSEGAILAMSPARRQYYLDAIEPAQP